MAIHIKSNNFEINVFDIVRQSLLKNAKAIERRLRENYSCENYLNHIFVKSFDDHEFIAVREMPHVDIGADDLESNQRIDIAVLSSDKKRRIFIEAKLVHDWTIGGYRDRSAQNGNSILGDLNKIRSLHTDDGHIKLILIYMFSFNEGETPDNWIKWLRKCKELDLPWFRIVGDGEPLLKFSNGGWLDICALRI